MSNNIKAYGNVGAVQKGILPRLLVIDDDTFFPAQITHHADGIYITEQSLAVMPLDALSLLNADTIIIDLNMPGVNEESFIKAIASQPSTYTLTIAKMAIRDTLLMSHKAALNGNVSINVPPQVLVSETFADQLCGLLTLHGLSPERFQCEITGRGLESSSPQALATLSSGCLKGIQLSIDDFGVGHSGLSKIKSRAFNETGIDRSFISDLTSSVGRQGSGL